MPLLGDYLGQLVSELTIARMHADLESIRIAELYASHALLRHMPVPHFRLPEVELDLPVVMREAEKAKPGESPRGGASPIALANAFEELLPGHLAGHGFELGDDVRAELRPHLVPLLRPGPSEVPIDLVGTADRLSGAVARALASRSTVESDQSGRLGLLRASLRLATLTTFLGLRAAPPRLHVLVTGADLREFGGTDRTMKVRVKVTEQAVEWTTVDAADGVESRLVPE